MMFLIVIIICCLLSLGQPVQAENNWVKKIKPTITQVQYAGNLGLVSVGIGKTFCKENISSFLIYGYLPKNINGVEVHTVAWKAIVDIKKIVWHGTFTGYTGITLMRCFANNAYTSLPDYYPKGYYNDILPMAIHAAPLIGYSYSWSSHGKIKKNTSSIFVEVSTMDTYIKAYIDNRDKKAVDFDDIWSLGIGMRSFF